MTPLRQRMIHDLRVRNYSERTVESYVYAVAKCAKHFGRSLDHLGPEEIRLYQQHLLQRRVSWSLFNQANCALRFFFRVTVGRPDMVGHLPYGKRPKKLPVVLSADEVRQLLEAAAPANRQRQDKLDLCRRLLLVATVAEKVVAANEDDIIAPATPPTCPVCGGDRFERLPLSAALCEADVPLADTS